MVNGKIKTLYADRENQEAVFPRTKVNAISDENGTGLNIRLKNAAPHNLLDNSYFVDPIAQAGVNGLHGTKKYAIDRWNLDNDLTATQTANGLQLISGGNDWWAGIVQHLETSKLPKNKTMTFAVRGLFSCPMRIYIFGANIGGALGVVYFNGSSEYKTHIIQFQISDSFPDDKILISISPDTEGVKSPSILQWAALYEGEYTAATLPEYQPKGYGVELAECMRYYRPFIKVAPAITVANTAIQAEMVLEPPMRVAPTFVHNGHGNAFTVDGEKTISGSYLATSTKHRIAYVFYTASVTPGTPAVVIDIDGYLSADL